MITLYVLAFIIASLLYRRRHRHIDMRTVRRLELERYMGRWYEIARYDRPFERRLRNIEARYTLRADGNVEMERAGIDIRTGHRHTSCRHARRTQRSGRLRVKNFIFLHTDYCILELDDQYQWALVGSTAPLRLQILSRQPRIRRDTLRHIVGLAERRGYPLDRLRLLRSPLSIAPIPTQRSKIARRIPSSSNPHCAYSSAGVPCSTNRSSGIPSERTCVR